MKAVVLNAHGGLEQLEYREDIDKPIINSNEVLIQVKACALNHLDIFTRNGLPGVKLQMPHISGSDIAGVVIENGNNVQTWQIGDRVVINPGIWCNECNFCLQGEHSLCNNFRLIGEHLHGGYAEYAKIPARNLLKLPDHITFEQAAAASLSLLTAYRMVIKRGRLRAGETVAVIGAGGGVSTMAIQLAKLAGAYVYATTSSDEKIDQSKKIGADKIFNYIADETWWKTIYYETKKQGVDMVIDSVGQFTWDKSLRLLKKGGRLVTCGATTGPMGKTNINLIFWNQLEIIGSTMASHSEFIEAMQFLFDGKIQIPIKTFSLHKAAAAQKYLEDNEQFGKIVLIID